MKYQVRIKPKNRDEWFIKLEVDNLENAKNAAQIYANRGFTQVDSDEYVIDQVDVRKVA